MKSIKQTLMSGAMILALSFVFTSCDDILGEWDKPAPNPVVPTPTPEPEPEPTPIPGLLTGKFTINASGDKIQFSQGNLQATYDGTKWTWAFAEHQWDYIGGRSDGGSEPETGNNYINGNGTVSAAGTVDLFGWVGESSTVLTSDPAKYGISNSITLNDYGTNSSDALKNDWGNTIGTGWRTLTGGAGGEWRYLLEFRTTGGTVFGTASARYAHATINTDGTPVNGLILFPDGVDIADSEVTTAGTVNGTSAWGTECTSAQWTALAAKGCVFLPAAGRRTGTTVNEANNGYYWSSSNSEYAHNVDFGSSNISYSTSSYRYRGCSVRLVRDVE